MKIGKNRGTVWTPPMEDHPEVAFEIRALTPQLSEEVGEKFTKQSLVAGTDGKVEMQTEFKSYGLMRAQAKELVCGWRGIVGDESMGEHNGKPLPCTKEFKDLVFDIWDDGKMVTHVNEAASTFNQLREESLKNSAPSSASA